MYIIKIICSEAQSIKICHKLCKLVMVYSCIFVTQITK